MPNSEADKAKRLLLDEICGTCKYYNLSGRCVYYAMGMGIRSPESDYCIRWSKNE